MNRALLLEGLTKSGRTWPVFGAYKLRSATSNCLFCSAAAFTALSRHVQVGLPLVGDDKYGEASPLPVIRLPAVRQMQHVASRGE